MEVPVNQALQDPMRGRIVNDIPHPSWLYLLAIHTPNRFGLRYKDITGSNGSLCCTPIDSGWMRIRVMDFLIYLFEPEKPKKERERSFLIDFEGV